MVSANGDECDSEPLTPLRPRYIITVLAVMGVVWVALFVVRVHAHQPNVDDYFYASTAKSLYRSANPISAFLHTGQTSPLVPAMAALGAGVRGIYGALAVELPLVLVLVAGCFVLARVWVSPVAAMVVALVAGLNIEVLSFAMMLNFAIASTAAVVWCFASYLRSDHLRNWRWALTFGIAMGALALSRSVAPVYFAPLVLVVAYDYVLDVRRNGHFWRWPGLLAVGSLLVLAGPWWTVSGHAALHYLLNAGYNPASGYLTAPQGFDLTLMAIHGRIVHELLNLGWFQSWVLGGAIVAAAAVAVLGRRRLNGRSLWMLLVWSVLTLLLLSSSSNLGTAFGLPVLVIVVVLCGSVLGQFPAPALRWALVPLAAVVVVGLAFQFISSVSVWWPGPSYRWQVIAAGGSNRTNVSLITAQVAHAIGKTPTVVVQNDPIVNVNGLVWELGDRSALLVPPSSQTETAAAVRDLPRANALITGTNLAPFYASMDPLAVERAALADGYRPAQLWRVGTSSSVVVWRRRGEGEAVHGFPPVTAILRPKKSGTAIKGVYFLDARASAVFGLMSVKFDISGATPQQGIVVSAVTSPVGWLGGLDTAQLPDGVYTIRSIAEDFARQTTRSTPTVVRIDN
jgi:hypothetical protein